MKILVANIGSTSFKYRLFDMADERELARGGVERIGSPQSRSFAKTPNGESEQSGMIPDHAAAIEACLRLLCDPKQCVLKDAKDLTAIGFKAVHAKNLTGVHRVDDRVLAAMEAYNGVAPAHNPPYVKAMHLLMQKLPRIPLIAAFETEFHKTIPPANRLYAIPLEWSDKYGIQRHGFHGASHRYIAERMATLLDNPHAKIISCHLGGSSSLCAIRDGQSVATSMGFSPQSGLPQGERVGDFDPFAFPELMRATGMSLDQLLGKLASQSGLKGLSCGFDDLRDIETEARNGGPVAKQALEVFVAAVRHYLGAYLLLLNGADAVVFTGGIGENSPWIRSMVCSRLDWFGIRLDESRNRAVRGEAYIHADASRVQIWAMPTNEELIVARQTKAVIEQSERESIHVPRQSDR